MKERGKWVTIKGHPVFIEEGQTLRQAMQKYGLTKKERDEQEEKKQKKSAIVKQHTKQTEKKNKREKELIDKLDKMGATTKEQKSLAGKIKMFGSVQEVDDWFEGIEEENEIQDRTDKKAAAKQFDKLEKEFDGLMRKEIEISLGGGNIKQDTKGAEDKKQWIQQRLKMRRDGQEVEKLMQARKLKTLDEIASYYEQLGYDWDVARAMAEYQIAQRKG